MESGGGWWRSGGEAVVICVGGTCSIGDRDWCWQADLVDGSSGRETRAKASKHDFIDATEIAREYPPEKRRQTRMAEIVREHKILTNLLAASEELRREMSIGRSLWYVQEAAGLMHGQVILQSSARWQEWIGNISTNERVRTVCMPFYTDARPPSRPDRAFFAAIFAL